MYAQVEKPKENTSSAARKSKAVANSIAQKQRNEREGFEFVDNRPRVVAQRKLQKTANFSSQAKLAAQLKSISSVIQLAPRGLTQAEGGMANIAKIAAIRKLDSAKNRATRTLAAITARFPGITTTYQRSEIHRRLEKIRVSINNVYAWKYDPAHANVFAYVYPNDETICYLAPAFFGAALHGLDGRAGAIIHEISHHNKSLGTDDLAYGQAADVLAFDLFKRNADSLEHFAEWY